MPGPGKVPVIEKSELVLNPTNYSLQITSKIKLVFKCIIFQAKEYTWKSGVVVQACNLSY
jgi:hypothetical protein